MQKLVDSLELYASKPDVMMKCVVLSLLSQLFTIGIFIVAGASMPHAPVSLLTYFFAGSIGLMILALPISPGGIGVGQAAFVFLFKIYGGHSSSIGANVVTVCQALLFFLSLWGLLFYVRTHTLTRTV